MIAARRLVNMGFSLLPQYSFHNITDITVDFLISAGIRYLMLDLDNTIAAYCEDYPSDDVLRWVRNIKDGGITLKIISNSSRIIRVSAFAEAFSIGSVIRASKPSPTGLKHSMEDDGFTPCESALAGDQIFTDTLAANRADVLSIIVKPKKFTNPFLALRYAVELPFRALVRNKQRRNCQ